jgi:hypothetical protein
MNIHSADQLAQLHDHILGRRGHERGGRGVLDGLLVRLGLRADPAWREVDGWPDYDVNPAGELRERHARALVPVNNRTNPHSHWVILRHPVTRGKVDVRVEVRPEGGVILHAQSRVAASAGRAAIAASPWVAAA